jgi:hypothetical protein
MISRRNFLVVAALSLPCVLYAGPRRFRKLPAAFAQHEETNGGRLGVAVLDTATGERAGMPMSRKEQPELVTSGPYAFIRHPIYTGLILATLGSAIGVNIFWAVMLVPVGAYFIFSARREETVMLQLFPEQYTAYMARTGMLAPRLFRRG